MRIRRRPPLLPLSSPSLNPNPASLQLQIKPPTISEGQEEKERGLHQVGDLNLDPSSSDLHPKSTLKQVIKDEEEDDKELGLDSFPSSQVQHNNESTCRAHANTLVMNNVKKRRSPAVLVEGSRCSRVNGRGWRCSQQTLIGYSLCEHHLGKGRLKSISSVREGSKSIREPKAKKIGIVKARSMSSLLDEAGDDDIALL